MAIQISGNTVIDDSRNYLQVANIEFSDSTVQSKAGGPPTAGPSIYDQFEEIATITNPNLDGEAVTDADYFGEGIAISGKYMAISSSLADARAYNNVEDINKGIVHVYDTETFQLLYTLTNPDPDYDNTDSFGGRGVATNDTRASIAADGNYLVVGSPGEDNVAGNVGLAYVYDIRNGTLLHTLDSNYVNTTAFFGYSVDISNGVVAVGAPLADDPSTDAGEVFLFQINSTSPNNNLERLGKIVNPDSSPSADDFGTSVAIDGNLLVVGSPDDDPNTSSNNGRAHIFNAFDGTLVATISNPDGFTNIYTGMEFGINVQIKGNIVAIGQKGWSGQTPSTSGKIYVYDISVSTSTPRFTVEGSTSSSWIGKMDFRITEDYLVVPDPRASQTGGATAISAGKISIYDITDGSLVGDILNPIATNSASTTFGYGCCAKGSLLVAGRRGQSQGVLDTAHVFALNPISNSKYFDKFELTNGSNTDGLKELLGTYSLNTYDKTYTLFKNPVAQTAGEVGTSVSVWNDRVAIGAAGYDGGQGGAFGNNAGRVYICDFYSGEVIKILESPHESAVGNTIAEEFGMAVAMNDKWLVVYAPLAYDDANTTSQGRAYLYDANDYHLICELRPTIPSNNSIVSDSSTSSSRKIWNLALDGDLLAIGTPGYKVSTNVAVGAVFMFDLRESYGITGYSSNWRSGFDIPSLYSYKMYDNPNNYGNAEYDWFGHSIALKGSILAVGVPYENISGAFSQGVVYVYDTTVLASPATQDPALMYSIDNPNANTSYDGDYFGASVALDGGKLIVGAPREDSSGGASDLRPGIVYIFDATTGEQLDTVRPGTNHQYEQFGESIVANNGYIVATARGNTSVNPDIAERVYIIDINTAEIVHYIENPNIQTDGLLDAFGQGQSAFLNDPGSGISLHNGNLAVSAAGEDISGVSSGSVYMFPIFKKTNLDRLVEMVY